MLQAVGSDLQLQAPLATLPVLVVHVNARCNCRCAMCDIWKIDTERKISAEIVQSLCDSVIPLGVKEIALTGGEPFMNPELRQICEALRRESPSLRITVLTSGLLLQRNSDWLEGLVDEVIVSVDGCAGIHDQIRGVRGGFLLIEAGAEEIRKRCRSVTLRARTTVQKLNHSDLVATADAVSAIGMSSVSFLAADVSSHAFNRELLWPVERQAKVILTAAEVARLSSEIDRLIEYRPLGFVQESPEKLRRIVRHFRAALGIDESQSPPCNAPWNAAVVEVDGVVRPCFFHVPIGAISAEKSLNHAVNSAEARSFREKLDVASNETCRRCVCSLNYRARVEVTSSSPL